MSSKDAKELFFSTSIGWQVVVLAAVRLGCNLDYDQLQDLAENHRSLRGVLGVGDWDQSTHFG